MDPLISVIIPAYNHERYIGEALHSVLAQDYPDLEIIVVDDGSQDATADLAEDILKQGRRPYRLIRQANSGAHIALNTGISLAQGEYIAILNSDDRFYDQRLSKMLRELQGHGNRFSFSQVLHIDENGSPHPYHPHYLQLLAEARRFPTISFALLWNNLAITTGNFFFHRSLYEEVGPFAPYTTCHDWDYLLRVILLEEPLFVQEELFAYRIHPTNTLRKHNELVEEEARKVRANYIINLAHAKNPLAPGPKQWGPYWWFFMDHYLQSFSDDAEVCDVLRKIKTANLQNANRKMQSILLDTLQRNGRIIEELESKIEDLNQEILQRTTQIDSLKDQVHAPLYFALRKLIYPLYQRLGGERTNALVKLKDKVKGFFGLKKMN